MAPQFTATNGPSARGEFWWSALATSSLPVPDSPTISTVDRVGRHHPQPLQQLLHGREWPTMSLEAEALVEPLPEVEFSSDSTRRSRWSWTRWRSSCILTGLVR